MNFETLQVVTDGDVGRIRLSRPDKRNALSRQALAELAEAARLMDATPHVRVVVIEGAGPAFCAGVDLDDYGSFLGPPGSVDGLLDGAARALHTADLGRAAAAALAGMRPLTIAKVHGYAVGGGAVLVVAADLRVFADDAYLWIPEVELGTPLVWGAVPRLVAEIGPARTTDLVVTCRRVGAHEALAMGLASRVVQAADLDAETDRLAREVAGRARFAVEATTRHVEAVVRAMSAGDTSYADRYLQAASWLDPEVRQRAADYLDDFRGRRGRGSA